MRISAASGIAIAPILFIIALLAILATAIAAGSSGFGGDTEQEKARVYASEMMAYADTVAAAVQRVMAMGCKEDQISFENSFVSGYTNPNAPADYHCHIFHLLGGGVTWINTPEYFLYSNTNTYGGHWDFTTGSTTFSLDKLGTAQHDLFLQIFSATSFSNNANADITAKGDNLLKICKEVNKMVGIAEQATATTLPKIISNSPFATNFIGTYNSCSTTQNMTSLYGKTAFCIEGAATGYIRFVRVLLVR